MLLRVLDMPQFQERGSGVYWLPVRILSDLLISVYFYVWLRLDLTFNALSNIRYHVLVLKSVIDFEWDFRYSPLHSIKAPPYGIQWPQRYQWLENVMARLSEESTNGKMRSEKSTNDENRGKGFAHCRLLAVLLVRLLPRSVGFSHLSRQSANEWFHGNNIRLDNSFEV